MTEILAPAIPMRPRATRVRKPNRRSGSVPQSNRAIIASWFLSYLPATSADTARLQVKDILGISDEDWPSVAGAMQELAQR